MWGGEWCDVRLEMDSHGAWWLEKLGEQGERAQPGPYCTYQSPGIPTFALGIIGEVINTSGTAFGYDFGSFLFLTWIWMKTLGLIALTQGHGVLTENYRKWRWIKRGKLTANVRRKEVRHMRLHSCLIFSPSVSCEHFEWNTLDLQGLGTFIFSELLERWEHFAVVW